MVFGSMEVSNPWKGLGAPLQLGLDQVPSLLFGDRPKEAAGWDKWPGRLCIRQRCRLGEGEAQKVLVRGQQGTGLG